MKPLDRYVLACVVHHENLHDQGAICSDVVRLLRWDYGLTKEHGNVAKRLSDLRADGLIRRVGSRRSELTRHAQAVYVSTAKGRRHAQQKGAVA